MSALDDILGISGNRFLNSLDYLNQAKKRRAKQAIKDLFIEIYNDDFFKDITVEPGQILSKALRAKAVKKIEEL